MKISPIKRDEGSVLVIGLFTCCAIGIVLASALKLVSHRNLISFRSMTWNAALSISEAGIEEAMSHWQTDHDAPSANGWTPANFAGQTVYTKTRSFDDGSFFNVLTYNPSSNTPVIYSAGFVPSPLNSGAFITRLVKITTLSPPSAFGGITANGLINLGDAAVDSYDGNLGAYDAVTNHGGGVTIATNSKLDPAVQVDKTDVYGRVITGPGGIISLTSGTIGDDAWNASNSGIQPGATNNNMNMAFPSNAPPSGGPFLPPTITTVSGSNIMYMGNVTNQLASYSETSQKNPIIVTGNATLYVTGDVSFTGNSYIYIAPGGSLTLYVGGSAKFGGGGIINGTGQAANFTYVGLSGNTSIDYGGASAFVGTINAPSADIKISGGYGFYGAIICNTFVNTGNSEFHYDSSLAKLPGPWANLITLTWTEL